MNLSIAEAVEKLRKGELVVLPTETVYGLAGCALNEVAVAKIFLTKGRPASHPLIVHVESIEQAKSIAQSNEKAELLARRFWPGPLTLILPKKPILSMKVTGGMDTVAVRSPSHPAFREILFLLGEPLAAPSANRFTELSPTRAEDVSDEVLQYTGGVVDCGPCELGIESTVLDCTCDPPVVLRPGPISGQQLSATLDTPVGIRSNSETKSPGMHPKHYLPPYKVEVVDIPKRDALALTFSKSSELHTVMPSEPQAYARALYAVLSNLAKAKPGVVQIEAPPHSPEWDAVWDRLRRMSS